MPRVSELMTRDVITLSPETTIREAMEILSTKHLSGAPVVVGGRVEGVVSMTDLLEFVISAPAAGESAPAESMADNWERADDPTDDVDDMESLDMSADAWEEWPDSSAGTVDDALPQGAHLLDQHTVDEVMTNEIVSVTPGTSVKAAAATMNKHKIHRVLVMKDGAIVGILSAFDIVRTVGARGTADDSGVSLKVGKGVPCVWPGDTPRS